jgi:outer membrane protein OmpA-like peptidoglycan-associated protein
MKTPLLTGLLVLCFSLCCRAQQDNPECTAKTFTFFTTFDGYYIERCEESEFGSYKFELDGSARIVEKKGKYRVIWFKKKKDSQRVVSGLQIIQNHVNAIKAVGGEVVKGSEDGIYKTMYQGNELWIHLKVYSGNKDVDNFGIFSIESMPMAQEVSAVSIKGAMDSQGKIALYGILFDTGKSDIKPESEKELKVVAGYLQSNPTVAVYIVGHTDNVGDAAANLKLSKSRGESVKQYLITKHKIDGARLTGDGVGSLCPVAPNDNESGKKLNRRVEIVKR